ncbi:MAG: hypothetical protein WDN06_20270 [Asticcacaulis sp.]
MAADTGRFIVNKEELKPGLILFRRADVNHQNFLLPGEGAEGRPV